MPCARLRPYIDLIINYNWPTGSEIAAFIYIIDRSATLVHIQYTAQGRTAKSPHKASLSCPSVPAPGDSQHVLHRLFAHLEGRGYPSTAQPGPDSCLHSAHTRLLFSKWRMTTLFKPTYNDTSCRWHTSLTHMLHPESRCPLRWAYIFVKNSGS